MTAAQNREIDYAIEAFEKAVVLNPGYVEAYNNLANIFVSRGDFDEAKRLFRKALSLKPSLAEAHRHLSILVKYAPCDPQIDDVRSLLGNTELIESDRCQLHYTYAKMCEDIGDLDNAFKNYVIGGELRKKLLSYDLVQDQRLFEKVRTDALRLDSLSPVTAVKIRSNIPIFIIGMPRSGTTLVENIISSNSQVYGAGELNYLGYLVNQFIINSTEISFQNILQVRNHYLTRLEEISNGSLFVTDKMPQNFLHVAVILKALPEAKIIHVTRDPAATCWSNFKHYFETEKLAYSYSLEDTVNYFSLYKSLMKFWNKHYPGQIYQFDYDRLTNDQVTETKQLIDYLQLDWSGSLLSPENNERIILTASSQQVRKKIYKGSSHEWRKFDFCLNGLFDQLYA